MIIHTTISAKGNFQIGKLPQEVDAKEKSSTEGSGQNGCSEGGIERREALAMIGLHIHMGVVNVSRTEYHGSADPYYDFQIWSATGCRGKCSS